MESTSSAGLANAFRFRTFNDAVREGWAALHRRHVAPPGVALRAISCWVPLRFAIAYWIRLLRSPRSELVLRAAHATRTARNGSPRRDVRALSKRRRYELALTV